MIMMIRRWVMNEEMGCIWNNKREGRKEAGERRDKEHLG
jgi:hypothetical protein